MRWIPYATLERTTPTKLDRSSHMSALDSPGGANEEESASAADTDDEVDDDDEEGYENDIVDGG